MDWSGSLFLDKKLPRRDLYRHRHIWQLLPLEFRHPSHIPDPSSRQVVEQEYHPLKTDHPLFRRRLYSSLRHNRRNHRIHRILRIRLRILYLVDLEVLGLHQPPALHLL